MKDVRHSRADGDVIDLAGSATEYHQVTQSNPLGADMRANQGLVVSISGDGVPEAAIYQMNEAGTIQHQTMHAARKICRPQE
jgi:hypothetical protein